MSIVQDACTIACVRIGSKFGFFFLAMFSAIEHFVRKNPALVNISKDDGYTPLHLASLNDHLDVVTALSEMVSSM